MTSKTEAMENQKTIFEPLLEKVVEYSTSSLELIKLKALEKLSDIYSSLISDTVVIVYLAIFILFLNIGLGLWLGEILGKIYFGFFVLAAFYLFAGLVIKIFMYKWIKKIVRDKFIKQHIN